MSPAKLRRIEMKYLILCFIIVSMSASVFAEADDTEIKETGKIVLKMEPKIVELEPMTILGMEIRTKDSETAIPQLWEKFIAHFDKIRNSVIKDRSWGVSYDIVVSDDYIEFTYLAGCEVAATDTIPEGYIIREIPAHKYAMFIHTGPVENIGETYDFIWSKWLPTSQYEYDPSNDMELYDERFNPTSPNSQVILYTPVKDKIAQDTK